MRKANPWKAILLFFFAILLVEAAAHEWKFSPSFDSSLERILINRCAMAQNEDPCSEHVGNATINEVRKSGANEYYIEVRILNQNISNSTIDDWTVHFASNKGSATIELNNNNVDWSTYPWIIIPESLIPNQNYIDFNKGMEILLEDETDKPIDYLNVANYSNSLSPECNDFYFDTDMKTTNSHTILRDPDGTGNWTDAGSGNSGPPTRGDRNIGDIEPGDFNVVEVGEDRWAETLYTKISGKNFSVDVIRETFFTFFVELELVDAGSGESCANLDHIADLGYAEFYPFEFRTTVTELSYGNAIASARIRATDVYAEDVQGCSLDTFTIRPAHLTLNATDRDWEHPGTNRTLNNTNHTNLDTCQEAGGAETCHIASHSFTALGTARNDANGTATGYSATTDFNMELHAPSEGSLGNFSPQSVYFNESEFRTDNATYDEVGLVNGTLNDIGRFATLSGDKQSDHCVEGSSSNTRNEDGLYGCQTATQSPRTVGRFIPDHFQLTPNAPFFEPFCNGFTYIEQPFYYSVAPSITLTARNAHNGTTENYGGDFWRFNNPAGHLGNREYNGTDSADAFLNTTLHENATVNGDNNYDGKTTFTLPSYYNSTTNGDEFQYMKNGTEDPFNATVDLTLDKTDLTDHDGVCYEVNGSCSGYTIEDISGTEIRYGRAVAENAYGSELLPLKDIGLRAQYYDGTAFVRNQRDNCTAYNASEIDWSSATYHGNLTASDVGSSGEGALEDGKGTFRIHKKGNPSEGPGMTGYVDYHFPVPAWLEFDWNDNATRSNPSARATFGIYKGSEHVIYQQETTWK